MYRTMYRSGSDDMHACTDMNWNITSRDVVVVEDKLSQVLAVH